MDYHFLDLEIERRENGYQIALDPLNENLSREIAVPFSPEEREELKARLSASRQTASAPEATTIEAFKQAGRRLHDALFDDAGRELLERRLTEAQDQAAGLHLRLRFKGECGAEWVDLPWEYLYDEQEERFLFRSKDFTLSRFFEKPRKSQPLSLEGPLRILAVLPRFGQDADATWTRLNAALASLVETGKIQLERLPGARLADLQRRLEQAEEMIHALHFIGQGNFETGAEEGALLLEDDAGQPIPVSGQLLGLKLGEHRPLRLLVFQPSGEGQAGCPFLGAARGLLEQRFPAVVTTHDAMSAEAASLFIASFYEALVQHRYAEDALANARATLSATGSKLEWGAPLLALGIGEGRLFDREKKRTTLATPDDRAEQHFGLILQKFAEGKVIPFLGAGASLCSRPPGIKYEPGKYLPNGRELSQMLAGTLNLPESIREDLLRVSQYYSLIVGEQPLYDQLHKIFDGEYLITPLHKLLGEMPGMLRAKGYGTGHLLVLTTNYDDLLERAFQEAGEPYDLLYYEAKKNPESRGKFWHEPHGGERKLVTKPNEYLDVSAETRSVILKIHGAVDRRNGRADSYVITEDDYIDYLTRTEISTLLPVKISDQVFESHLLFLGYSLRDWNLRTILHRIEMHRALSYRSWAIQKEPEDVDAKFWSRHNVDIFDMDLDAYVGELRRRLRELAPAGGAG